MQLTEGERLIVTMLADLARSPDRRELDFEFIAKAVLDNHLWAIDWKYPSLGSEEEADSSGEVTFVAEILTMWQSLEFSAAGYSDADWEAYEAQMGRQGREVKFHGFDGNNETGLMGIARFMVEDLNRFSSFKGRGFNSHMPSADRYRRMLRVFNSVRAKLEHGRLEPTDMAQVMGV